MSETPLLEARSVGFEYRADVPVLSDWSARFPAGSTTALTGPSGSGKSTVLYLLGLMLRPARGRVRVNGERVDDKHDRARADLRARTFGFVFQDAALDVTRTVMDNIVETALYRGQDRAEAVDAARGLMERFEVDIRADHRPGQISGGQAQRVALCRALLSSPAILLADEPTGNLDPATGRIVMTAMKEHAAAGSAVVVATHDPSVAAACDRHLEITP